MNVMTASNRLIDSLIVSVRGQLTAELFQKIEALALKLAEYAVPAGALLGFIIAVVGAIKLDSFFIFASGIVWVALVAVCYYIGHGFTERCRHAIANSKSELSATEFLKVFALLTGVGTALAIGTALYLAIQTSSLEPLKWAVPVAVILLLYTTLLLNPSLISTEICETATGGQDALAISLVLYKAGVRQAGIIFGAGTTVGAVLLAYSLYNLFGQYGAYQLVGGLQSVTGVLVLLGTLLFPFFIYLFFVFAYLFVDLCRAILTLNQRPPSTDGNSTSPQSTSLPHL